MFVIFLIEIFFCSSDDHDVLSFLLFRLTEPGQQPVITFFFFFWSRTPNTFPIRCVSFTHSVVVYVCACLSVCVHVHLCVYVHVCVYMHYTPKQSLY